ncbi:MAG: hypothetical protein ACOCXA_04570 [Planctomycetota bacterium]
MRLLPLAVCLFVALPLLAAESLDLAADCRHQWDALIRHFNDGKLPRRTGRAFNEQAGLSRADHDPVTVLLRRTQALLADLQARAASPQLDSLQQELTALEQSIAEAPPAEWVTGAFIDTDKKAVSERRGKVVGNADVRYPLFEQLYHLQRRMPRWISRRRRDFPWKQQALTSIHPFAEEGPGSVRFRS